MDATILDIASLLLAVFLGYLAVKEFVDHRTEVHQKQLDIVLKSLSRERYVFAEKALELHHEKRHQLICHEDWILSFEDKIPLSDVNAVLECTYHSETNQRADFKMPYPYSSYADNVKIVTGKYITPLPIYGLHSAPSKTDRRIDIPVNIGKYSDFYNSCEYLAFEIAHAIHIRNIDTDKLTMKELPFRKRTDPFKLDNRFAGIGICTLTIVKNIPNDDRQYFLVHNRSGKMAEGGEVYHVVPAGSYQPILKFGCIPDQNGCLDDSTVNKPNDLSPGIHGNTISDSALREFIEEVADKDCESLSSVSLLEKYRRSLYADAFYLGIGLEPVNLKTEMLSIYIIDYQKSSLFDGYTSLKEFIDKTSSDYEGEIRVVPFEKQYLEQYMYSNKSFPSFREILRIVYEGYDICLRHQISNNLSHMSSQP